ncbi:amidohydrolase family protein [Pelagibacterium halotolerans]|uniref:Cytosine deaminase n=1 Tax=Pelagibacterium halotolerans (strain DSM 22347 / JCM 15775 / CGMCC 1.7692 / B2) TaxID=1082931 RepID=G4REP1_PELHB|nr:amidohydrolase family protein [Pelagibacterium halotolerans]AEQ50891.1 cytosine deaminase [Pelagibacterium halotolerans B2]QJR19203.1 amidohydrolase family protein [Pelagibacterium halotolerans]SDZ99135.1 cytosine deaminase [Pelagibacterium halotolerans]
MSAFDLLIVGVTRPGHSVPCEIGVIEGRIAAIGPELGPAAVRIEAQGAMAIPGYAETHIHLDKAMILDRCSICNGTLAEAVSLTASAKSGFTREDVYARAAQVIEMAIVSGTNAMRSFVELDPRAGLRSFQALLDIRRAYDHAINLTLCAFAQEGLTQELETAALLKTALENGADQIGGCPYMDPDPTAHVTAIFDLAQDYNVAVDFHADFDLDPEGSALPEIIAQTERRGWGGRVSIGHATKMSAMAPQMVDELARRLASAGISVTALPATDLFLNGRDHDRLVPRGVAPLQTLDAQGVLTTIASNNVLNPFTPYGDANLIRMANLFANLAQLASDQELARCFDMVSANGFAQLGLERDLRVGAPADLVLVDAPTPADAVRRLAAPIMGFKTGCQTFVRERARLTGTDGHAHRKKAHP